MEKPVSEFPSLSEPISLKLGHTLHLVRDNGGFLGYLGFFGQEGITLLLGKNLKQLTPYSKIIPGGRWATAIKTNHGITLFCTKLVDEHKIVQYESADGKPPFKLKQTVASGRNPFIWRNPEDKKFYLYFQRRKEALREILVCVSTEVEDLPTAEETVIAKSRDTFGAPSISYFHDAYWLTCEARNRDRHWVTRLFRGRSPKGPFSLVGDILDSPCAFQHIFGDRYIITYSKRSLGNWVIEMREGKL